METVGWISGFLLVICGIPQVVKCIKQGHAHGISHLGVWLWILGETLGLIYVSWLYKWPLMFSAALTCVNAGIILRYILLPDRSLIEWGFTQYFNLRDYIFRRNP